MSEYQEMINRCHAENDAEFEETGGLITTKLAAKILPLRNMTIMASSQEFGISSHSTCVNLPRRKVGYNGILSNTGILGRNAVSWYSLRNLLLFIPYVI